LKKNKRLSYEEKLKICHLYEEGADSLEGLARQFGISKGAVSLLNFKYKNFGVESLQMQSRNKSYSESFKHKVIEAYRNGEGGYSDPAVKYKISNYALIARWVLGVITLRNHHLLNP